MEHYIKVQFYKNDEQYVIKYKGIKKKNSKYLIHKTSWKETHSNNIKMDSAAYLLFCMEHDIVKDNRIKKTDTVTVYLSLDEAYLEILNKAKQGKSVYSNLIAITNGQDRQYLLKWLKIIQNIYVKKQVIIHFKNESKVDTSIFNVDKICKKEVMPSYMVKQAKNTTAKEKEARREQFEIAFNPKNLNYEELINR